MLKLQKKEKITLDFKVFNTVFMYFVGKTFFTSVNTFKFKLTGVSMSFLVFY